MSTLHNKLKEYAINNLNALLIGSHGIGKSTIVKGLADELGLKLQYYSASTLDPWADLVGIPVPDKDRKVVDFYRPLGIQEAEFIFFDELNRAHPKVLQTLLEIIQFKSINGVKLDKLKMVWGAINPPGGEYQVEELDPVLVDRFHVFIKMEPELNRDYFKKVLSDSTFSALREWWHQDCSAEQRKVISPRRIEYIGMLIDRGLPWRDCMPQGYRFPVEELHKKLKSPTSKDEDGLSFTKENILANKDIVLQKIKENPKYAIKVAQVLGKFSPDQMFECRDLLEQMPKEMVVAAIKDKYISSQKRIKDLFEANKVDLDAFPKMKEAIKKAIQATAPTP
jgi:hypothetical protein